jgi:predicted nucleic acid-binding protein
VEEKFLVDTNILIYAQMKTIPAAGLKFLADVINVDFTVSFISYIEFLGYKDATQSSEEFIKLASLIEINKAIIDQCIELRKAHRIQLPDAIIAATAIEYGRTLITRNVGDFKNIDKIKLMNPFDL